MGPDISPPTNAQTRSLLSFLVCIVAALVLGACANAGSVASDDSPKPGTFALLVVVLVAPDGTYKEFVRYFKTVGECKAAIEDARAIVNKNVVGRNPYLITCGTTETTVGQQI